MVHSKRFFVAILLACAGCDAKADPAVQDNAAATLTAPVMPSDTPTAITGGATTGGANTVNRPGAPVTAGPLPRKMASGSIAPATRP